MEMTITFKKNWFKRYQQIFNSIRRTTWPTNEIIRVLQEDMEFDRNAEQWQKEWEKSLPMQEEQEGAFDVSDESKQEARRNYLLQRIEESTRSYYSLVQQKADREIIIAAAKQMNGAKIRYFFSTYQPEKDKSFSEQELERARNVPMDKLIQTNKAGFALCPFHQEKTPSFKVTKNMWYCFGCGIGGDSIEFVKRKDNLNFRDAVQFLLKI